MPSPKNFKEVQRLVGRITALSRFVSHSAEKSLPFFKILRKAAHFSWDSRCEEAFAALKAYLQSLPTLSKPKEAEPLWLYLSVSDLALGSVLVREDDKVQKPIYFVSHILKDAETRYATVEKLALALVLTARKLRPYFLSHPINVLTNSNLGKAMINTEASGRLSKWTVELSEYDVQFLPRTAIKAQALADFLTEIPSLPTLEAWKVYVDGSATKSSSGVGVLLESPKGDTLHLAVKLQFRVSNNEAEYEALLAGLQAARHVGAERVILHSDSQLATQQLEGRFETRNERLLRYIEMFNKLRAEFRGVQIIKIPRADNQKADELAKLASALQTWTMEGPVVQEQLIAHIEQVTPHSPPEDWRLPFVSFLRTEQIPEEVANSRVFKRRASQFILVGDLLYKKAFARPFLKCLTSGEGDYVLRELHRGCCGNHIGGRSLARKVILAGYFWPTLQVDAARLVKACESCQRHHAILHQPAEYLKTSAVSCPFDQWGIDIVGPLPTGPNQKKYLLVAVDYFSKWVEAEALARVPEEAVLKFLWRNIVCRYGIPRQLVSDNGKQFQGRKLREWCKELNIRHTFTSVYYPQSNGQTEVVNREIVRGLKTRLDQAESNWVEELHHILWAYRTTPRESTWMTPFHLVYGSEAVVPVEIGEPSSRVQAYGIGEANADRRLLELDLITETREAADRRLQIYRQRMSKTYNKKVSPRSFQPGEVVWKKLSPLGDVGKLQPRWEGPYRVIKRVEGGSYYLADKQGVELPRPWNAIHLRPYHS